MAEAAGLALGGVALTGLLSTCVELFEYFESARDYISASNMGKTKISLLRMRMRRLTDVPAFQDLDAEEALRTWWPQEHKTIGESLCSIHALLDSACQLVTKYIPVSNSPGYQDLKGMTPTCPASDNSDKRGHPSPRILRFLSVLFHRTHWAVQDKKKLDSFIVDLEFLVTNLERLGLKHGGPFINNEANMHPNQRDRRPTQTEYAAREGARAPTMEAEMPSASVRSLSSITTHPPNEDLSKAMVPYEEVESKTDDTSTLGDMDEAVQDGGRLYTDTPSSTSSETSSTFNANSAENVGHSYEGNTSEKRATLVQGNIGESLQAQGRNSYTKNNAKDDSCMFNGNMDFKAFAHLLHVRGARS